MLSLAFWYYRAGGKTKRCDATNAVYYQYSTYKYINIVIIIISLVELDRVLVVYQNMFVRIQIQTVLSVADEMVRRRKILYYDLYHITTLRLPTTVHTLDFLTILIYKVQSLIYNITYITNSSDSPSIQHFSLTLQLLKI